MSKLEFTRGEIIAAKYEVVDVLEESPLGITHRVKHQKSGKFVRLTMLRPKIAGSAQKNQLLDVYKRVKDLQHPAVVKVGELGEHEGVAYFTAEDFEGQTLRDLISEYKVEGKQLGMREAMQIALQILDGFETLHKAGFFLRGMRPEYLLVSVKRTGPRNQNIVAKVKITGSGFWEMVPAGTLAEDEFARGEAQYLAPEMKSFEPTASPRADVYSAGVMIYEMLTGVAPLGTFQMPATLRPDLPKLINDIIELALANSPDDRYQSASDFMAAIQRTMSDEVADEEAPRTRMWPFIVGGLVVLAALVVIIYMIIPGEDDKQRAQQAQDTELRNDLKAKVQAKIPDENAVKALLSQQPPNMAYIPAGPYAQGRMHWDPDGLPAEPLAKVTETSPYFIDRFEYPNTPDVAPRMDVDFAEAEKLCSEQGKRLCTAVEWEKACKGLMNSVYAYDVTIPADTFDPSFCGDGLADRGFPSGAMEKCRSYGYGVYDMSGGPREWTATAPPNKDNRRYVKGGFPNNSARGTRCAFATDESVSFRDSGMSFRCCRDGDAAAWKPPAAPPAAPPTEPAPQ